MSVRRLRCMMTPTYSVATLMASVVAYVVVSLSGSDPFGMIDLRVYYEGAHHLWDDSSLYTFESSAIGLPFTYPPFAAVVFSAFAWLPWMVCRVLWQLGTCGAIVAIVHLALRLTEDVPRTAVDRRCLTALLTALALWMEPVRSTLNFGQINLFIIMMLIGGLSSRRSWISGGTVGLGAAVKLVPGISGLFYLLAGRRRAVLAAALTAVFAGWLGLLIAPRSSWTFFTTAILDPARTGEVAAVNNQSLRGAMARILGHDDVVLWAAAAAAILAAGLIAARRCLRSGDRFAGFLVVQIVGLLVSPISWNHHWSWVLPLLIWAWFGPVRRHRAILTLAVLWSLAVFSFLVSVQISARQHGPGEAWAEAVYPILGIVSMVTMGVVHGRTSLRTDVSRSYERTPAAVAGSSDPW